MLAAQVTHAAGESSPGDLPAGTYAVVLAADDLAPVEQHLIDNEIPHRAIRENDGDYAGQLVAIGVRPERRSKLKRHFSSLPLLR